jgi:hypothetical protein
MALCRRLLGWRPFQKTALTGLAIALFVLASAWVRGQVHEMKQYRISRNHLRITAPPSWLGDGAIETIKAIPPGSLGISVFQEDLIPAVGGMLSRLPWVSRVVDVKVVFPNEVTFRMILRHPEAYFIKNGWAYLLDREGYVLAATTPHSAASLWERLGIPEIVGFSRRGRAPLLGVRHPRVALLHGAVVASALRRADLVRALRSFKIDVSNVGGRRDRKASEIVLLVRGGSRIEWGRAALSAKLKTPLSQKLKRLKWVLRRDPSLKTLGVVKLQFSEVLGQKRPPKHSPALSPPADREL